MKGILRIGGALAIGVVIILGALYTQKNSSATAEGQVVVAKAPTRTYIETVDSDKDGVKDWEENLENRVFQAINAPTSTAAVQDDEAYVPPTTFTGKFSEAFFQDYLQGKMDGVDFSDPSGFVGNAVTAIEQNTASTRHSRLELKIVPTTAESVYAYGNRVAEIMKTHSIDNENEAVILYKALETSDPELLNDLEPIHRVYANTITDTLNMDVPASLVENHINLLNAYESIKTDIGAMRLAFTDPLYALARAKGYEKDAQALLTALQSIGNALTASGASYTNKEPGAFFYLFEI